VSADGTPASMEQIAKRTVVRIVDGHIVGLIAMLATGDRRLRLGDMVAGTVVTDAECASSVSDGTAHAASDPAVLGGPASKPATGKQPFFKRQLSLPSFGNSSKPNLPSLGRSKKPKLALASPAAPAPRTKKPSLRKHGLSLPSFGGSKRPKAAEA